MDHLETHSKSFVTHSFCDKLVCDRCLSQTWLPVETNIVTPRSKRKFQDEILELPVAKHTCLEKISTPPGTQSERNNRKILLQTSKEILHSQGLAIDSNNVSEDADSVMSRMKQHICPYDAPHSSSSPSSSSSVNWSGSGKPSDRLETKTFDEIYGYIYPSFELDCEFSSPGLETKQTEDEEASMEDVFCSNGNENENGGFLSNNYILSSGRWNVTQVNPDTGQGAEKLTIDKEFEEYFSMLML